MSAAADYPPPPPRYLPAGYRPEGWEALEPYFEELTARPIRSRGDLERWIQDRSELESAIAGEAARRNVANACHTEDAAAERRHLQYQMEVLPEVRAAADALDHRLLRHRQRKALDPARWTVYLRGVENAAALFREENLPLQAEEDRLSTEFGTIAGGMSVDFQGELHTLPMLARYLEEPDRALREAAWRAGAERRLAERERLDALFDRMRALRARSAANAGFTNYRDFKHRELERFDYTPEDCLALHENIRRSVLPVYRRLLERRRQALGLAELRPWDLHVDLEQRPAYRPFQDQAGQVEVAARVLEAVHPEFARDLRWMERAGLLDLQTRTHKRPGGFLEHYEDARLPFIFSNSPPTHDGIETLVHESGHAQHLLRCRGEDLLEYRNAPIEFAEVASMGLEAMALEHLDAAYPLAEARRAAAGAWEGIVRSLPWMALIDAFQHWVYLHPEHAAAARAAQWIALREQYQPGIDWSGLETVRASDWQRQPHVFEVPFYYVEYAIAQIGALQLWRNYRRDPAAALAAYRAGLALGGSRPLPELFAAAGLRFDPRGEQLPELMHELETAWNLNSPVVAR